MPDDDSRRSVSAVVLTMNEERNIERCLSSLTWADEILVVDGGSADHTLAICNRPGAPWAGRIRVLSRPWTGFREQRNFSLDQAAHDWILVVDADECCSPELSGKIRELLNAPSGPSHKAYKVRRIEYFLGKEITAGIWSPSYQDRFFHRAGVRYVNDVHEYPVFAASPAVLHEPLHHSPEFNTERFLGKMNKYTSIEALDRYNQGRRTNAFRLFFAFIAMFWKNYFYYRAYRDGMHGFIISLLEGVSRVVRHVKMWEISQRQ